MEKNNSEIKNGKVWLGEDGIIRIKTGERTDLDHVKKIVEKFTDIAKTLEGKAKILIDTNASNQNLGILYRRGVVKVFLDIYKNPGFEKIALWGGKNKMIEIVGAFMIGATGLKNIKYFKTEEKALKWLNEI